MTPQEPTPEARGNGLEPPVPAPASGGDGRVGMLRGAGVQIDGRRVARVLVGIVIVTLAVLVVVFTVVGIHKNDQIDQLHNQGVPVTFTVTGCMGLLGGTGTNVAGYACHGTYALGGHHYSEQLPGTALHEPGTKVAAVAVPGDPALVSPVSIVEHRARVQRCVHRPGDPARRAGADRRPGAAPTAGRSREGRNRGGHRRVGPAAEN